MSPASLHSLRSSFITVDGAELLISRIHRATIDRLVVARPPPDPPTRKVEIFGGLEEDVAVWDDPSYQEELAKYRLALGQDELQLIYPAIEVAKEGPGPEPDLLALFDKTELTAFERLQLVILANHKDLEQVVELVFYLSTVTPRGIQEATDAFGVVWYDKPITAYKIPGSPAMYNQSFRDRTAAQACGYNWHSFCELTGPEQSEIVAFYMLQQTLEYFNAKWRT